MNDLSLRISDAQRRAIRTISVPHSAVPYDRVLGQRYEPITPDTSARRTGQQGGPGVVADLPANVSKAALVSASGVALYPSRAGWTHSPMGHRMRHPARQARESAGHTHAARRSSSQIWRSATITVLRCQSIGVWWCNTNHNFGFACGPRPFVHTTRTSPPFAPSP